MGEVLEYVTRIRNEKTNDRKINLREKTSLQFEGSETVDEKNNLFYVCSLIEFIGRKTKNHRGI